MKCRTARSLLFFTLATSSAFGQNESRETGATVFLDQVTEAVDRSLAVPDGDDAVGLSEGKRAVLELKDAWDTYLETTPADDPADDPAIAAADWLNIFDFYTRATVVAKRADWAAWPRGNPREYSLTNKLPFPPSWSTLATGLRERATTESPGNAASRSAAALLADFFEADQEAFTKEWSVFLEAVEKVADQKEDDYGRNYLRQFEQLGEEFSGLLLTVNDRQLDRFEKELERWEDDDPDESLDYDSLEIPDIDEPADPARFDALLSRAMTLGLATDKIYLPGGKTVTRIADLIIADPTMISTPYPGLIKGKRAADLYAVYETQLPTLLAAAKKQSPDDWKSPMGEVFARQLEAGADAGPIIDQIIAIQPGGGDPWFPSEIRGALVESKQEEALFAIYKLVAEKAPDILDWSSFADTGADLQRSEEVLELVKQFAGSDKATNEEQKLELLSTLASAALAADEVEEGIGYQRERLEVLDRQIVDAAEDPDTLNDAYRSISRLGSTFEDLGSVLEMDALVDEGIALQRRAHDFSLSNLGEHYWHLSEAINFIAEHDGHEAAEARLIELTPSALESAKSLSEERSYPGENVYSVAPRAVQESLALVYANADQHEDLLRIVTEGPFWESPEFSAFASDQDDLLLPIVEAFDATGESEKAERLLVGLLMAGKETNNDRAYELLAKLQEPTEHLSTLDQLFKNDAFQERPLIWKGKALLQQRRLEEAEAATKKAIAIDPSDGEQEKGDRMRVYSVLAEIYEAQGKAEDAVLYREIVRSIRISEEADDVYSSGLKSRGIEQYREALTHFADAYCIQSRMAVQLNGLGKFEEAEKHYQRAFELMPDSFGRMESHCFGCEGAFSGSRAQDIAEAVFTRMINERPEKPQLHYLLGYLRDSQGRDAEALALYQEAVRLDPEYLNAWKKILGKSSDSTEMEAIYREAIFALAKLDPYGRHTSLNAREFFDLAAIYELLPTDSPSIDSDLLELTGTSQFLTKLVDYHFITSRDTYPQFTREQIEESLIRTSDREDSPFESILESHSFVNRWWSMYSAALRLDQ